MPKTDCLNEELLLDLYYGELPASPPEETGRGRPDGQPAAVRTAAEAHAHLAGCATCRSAWDTLRRRLDRIDATADPVPAPRGRALAGALRTLGLAAAGSHQGENTPEIRSADPAGKSFPTATPSGTRPTSASTFLPSFTASSSHPGTIMTLEEVADELRVTVEQARRLLGELPYLNIGGVIRVRRATFEAFLEKMEEESRRPILDLEHPVLRRQGLI